VTARSVFETPSAPDIEVLKSLTGKRTATMAELKKEFLSKHSQLNEEFKGRVLDMAMLFEKTIWLIHLLAESIDAENSPRRLSETSSLGPRVSHLNLWQGRRSSLCGLYRRYSRTPSRDLKGHSKPD
jgi:hypothetical protein